MRTDKLTYLIFKRLPQGFFSLIGRDASDAEKYLFKSVELKETAFRIDAIFQPKIGDDLTYFVEAQFQADEAFYGRFFAEIFLYLKQFEVGEWQGIVIYPSRRVETKKIRPYQKLLDIGLVKRIYLDELPLKNNDPSALFKLLIEPETSAPQLARDLIASSTLYLDVVQQILFYKFKDKSRRDIMKLLGIEEEILRETRAFQEILEEGRQEGLEKGKLEGIIAGKIEGKIEGRIEGKIEGKLETVPILRRLGLSDEQISKELGLPLADVQRVPKASQ